MDQLICASLSHTHYWDEVGMLKVPEYDLILIARTSGSIILFYYCISLVIAIIWGAVTVAEVTIGADFTLP